MKKLIIIFVLIIQGCHYKKGELLIVNSSKEKLLYELYYHKNLTKYDVYNRYQNVYYLDNYKILNPQDSIRPLLIGSLKYSIETISKDSTLTVALFNKDSVKKYGWDEIMVKKNYKKYIYKIRQLDSLGWKITYDGR